MGTAVSILPRVFEVVGASVEFDRVDGVILLRTVLHVVRGHGL
jgi:hypothetical protein